MKFYTSAHKIVSDHQKFHEESCIWPRSQGVNISAHLLLLLRKLTHRARVSVPVSLQFFLGGHQLCDELKSKI